MNRQHFIGFARHDEAQANGRTANTQVQRRDDRVERKERHTMFSTTYTTATRRLRALLAALVAVTALAAAAPPAPAAAAETGHRFPLEPCYTIESRLNGYVLQVGQHTFTGDGGKQMTEPDPRLDAQLVVGPKTPLKDEAPGAVYRDQVLHQVWVRYGDYLVSKLNGFAIDLLGGATNPGTPVVINPIDLGRVPNKVQIDADGYIVDHETGLVLDIAGNNTAPGAKVIAWKRKGLAWAANQRWTLVRVPDAACYPPSPYSYEIFTHYAGAPSGTPGRGTQGVPVVAPLHPDASMEATFTWRAEYSVLSIHSQFYGMVPCGGYMYHHQTVRSPTIVRKTLPPPSYNTVDDNWVAAYDPIIEIIETMPEEMYIYFDGVSLLSTGCDDGEGGMSRVEARLYPYVLTDGGDL